MFKNNSILKLFSTIKLSTLWFHLSETNSRTFEISKEEFKLLKSTENLNYTFTVVSVPHHSEHLSKVKLSMEAFSFVFSYDTSPGHLLPSYLLSQLEAITRY